MEKFRKWLRGKYCPYTPCGEKGYCFDIIINEHFRISGEGFKTEDERDMNAGLIANELRILLESAIYERIPNLIPDPVMDEVWKDAHGL